MDSLARSPSLALHYPRSRSPSLPPSPTDSASSVEKQASGSWPLKFVLIRVIRGLFKHQAALFGRFSDRPYSGAFASARTSHSRAYPLYKHLYTNHLRSR
jgi:hypothetical protein